MLWVVNPVLGEKIFETLCVPGASVSLVVPLWDGCLAFLLEHVQVALSFWENTSYCWSTDGEKCMLQISWNWPLVFLFLTEIRRLSLAFYLYIVPSLCPTLCNPMDCSLPGSTIHGILQARILEWVAISFSRGSSWCRDWTCMSCALQEDFLPDELEMGCLLSAFYCSVAQSCLTLCDSVDCSTPGFPILYCLPEFSQTHVHWVNNAMQTSHPLSSPPASFPASGSFPVSQLFASRGYSIGASVLPMNIQCWFPLGVTGLISLLSKGLSRVFSSTTVQKHHFLITQPFLWSNCHVCTGKTIASTIWIFVSKVIFLILNMLS